ncbi:hypothetical protein L0F63_002977 [Massospora cicadina]|nr:hypothetical protein L0F63_002977 [Massospora cicadina]
MAPLIVDTFAPRNSHSASLCLSSLAAKEKLFTIIGNRAYDITDFVQEHPGGAVILTQLGIDATEAFHCFHTASTQEILTDYYDDELTKKLCLADPKQNAQSSLESPFLKDVRALRDEAIKEGLFQSSLPFYLFIGLSNLWKDKHNTHHAAPNVYTRDPDIDTHPFLAWSENALELYAELNDQELGTQLKTVALPGSWPLTLLFVFVSQVTCGVLLASVFTLNHNGMRVLTSEEASKMDFYTLQCETGRDVYPSYFMTWFCGGLNYQIEHHMFPTLPRHSFSSMALHTIALDFTGTKEVLDRLDRVAKTIEKGFDNASHQD